MLHIKLNGITNAAAWKQIFCPQTMGVGSKGQFFSEHGHVAYQIKGNHECSNTVANILSADPPPPHQTLEYVQNVKIQLFGTWSCI